MQWTDVGKEIIKRNQACKEEALRKIGLFKTLDRCYANSNQSQPLIATFTAITLLHFSRTRHTIAKLKWWVPTWCTCPICFCSCSTWYQIYYFLLAQLGKEKAPVLFIQGSLFKCLGCLDLRGHKALTRAYFDETDQTVSYVHKKKKSEVENPPRLVSSPDEMSDVERFQHWRLQFIQSDVRVSSLSRLLEMISCMWMAVMAYVWFSSNFVFY